nr:reverse transcriptase domain-containing protein [Tanacetum cinerariifolium]
MSTRSSARNLFPTLDNPELTTQRRSRVDHTLLNDFKMAIDGNDDPPVPDLRTMEELCQPTLNGRGGLIALIAIQAMNFRLKNDMIQQVQNSCQFHRLSGDDANKHLDKFLHVTQSIKVNGVTDDALRLYLFPHSLTHHATTWFDRLPRNSINTLEQIERGEGKKNAERKSRWILSPISNTHSYLLIERSSRPEECYDLIENMTAHHNDWDTSVQWSESSSSIISTFDPEIVALKAEMEKINKNLMKVLQINQQVKAVTHNCETCGGPHSYNDGPATVGQTHNVYAMRAYQDGNSYQPQEIKETIMVFLRGTTKEETNSSKELVMVKTRLHLIKPRVTKLWKMNTASSSGSVTLPSNPITNPKEDFKGITTRSGTSYKGPTIPTTSFSPPQVVKRETEVTKDTVPPTNNGSTKDIQSPVVQIKNPIPNSEPVVAPVSAPKHNQKPSIPYPSRLHDQKLRDKANDQKEKFFQILKDLDFKISFADALILMPKFSSIIKSLLTNKEKLYELARTPLNEHCSTVLLKKLPEKLWDLGKFLIPCDFLGMDECLALTDLGESINLIPLSMWNMFSLPELSPTCMTLELVDRLISHPVRVAEDVFVKVGTFHFPADFVVVTTIKKDKKTPIKRLVM